MTRRTGRDRKAYRLYEQASQLGWDDPRPALDLLWRITEQYPDTPTVADLVIDLIIAHAEYSHLWDEAIEACTLGRRIRPQHADSYVARAEAFHLQKEGHGEDALEMLLTYATRFGRWYGDIRDYGTKFAAIGAHDRAWALYNEAVRLAVADGYSPHTVRQAMADLLMKENRERQAVEILIAGVWEAENLAKKGVPKSLTASIRKALAACGLRTRGLADLIVTTCKEQGQDKAVALFRAELANNK